LAEVAGEYLKKGSQIYVEGRIQTRKWQDKEGHDRYTTEIVVNEMTMLGGKLSGEQEQSSAPARNTSQSPARNPSSSTAGSATSKGGGDEPHNPRNGARTSSFDDFDSEPF